MVTDPEQAAPSHCTSLEGRYANGIQVGRNAFEFVLDFSQQYGGAQDAPPHTRIVTSPHYARGFLETLQAAIAAYEMEFGPIEAPSKRTEGEDATGH